MNTTKKIKKTTALIIMFLAATMSYAQSWFGWSEWQKSDCYEGISTRHRSQPSIQGKQKVQVEVRNNYRHSISIKTRLTNNQSDLPIYRFEIPAGETFSDSSTETFLLTGQRFYFRITDVRFGGDGYGDPYRLCDRY